jgi:hypothetical protein
LLAPVVTTTWSPFFIFIFAFAIFTTPLQPKK